MTSPSTSGGSYRGENCRVLIVGTAGAAVQLFRWLRQGDVDVRVVGCLIPRSTSQESAARVARVVQPTGHFEGLAETVADRAVDRVLITMPLTERATLHELAAQLDELGVAWSFIADAADQLAGASNGLIQPSAGGGHAAENVLLSPSASPVIATLAGSPAKPTGTKSRSMELDPIALLNREMAPLDEAAIARTLAGRTVMITGAGGSIGSELARIVARFHPARLVLVERAENALFEIDRAIARLHPQLDRAAVLHDVTDAPRTRAVVMAQRPDVVFHAAAHKHVPMMEEHPSAAVENNFYGTRSIADASASQGVDRFVMISTDKAVNPTSVMGATKRLAELYIQYLNARSDTTFSMVRFGNVLGSACSVLPIWSKQLADGDPLTVTHPDMMRYFMTIPEAAGLVLQSGALSTGGEVFLLDMGEPIRIVDMARRFIEARGLSLDVDASIVFTGIRPGEKLYEELAYDGEDMLPTPHRSIRIWRTTPPDAPRMQAIVRKFDQLRGQANDDAHRWQGASDEAILTALRQAVPEMRVSDDVRLKQTA